MSEINEEVHPQLLEAWKLFDEKARQLDVKYSIEADEPLRQVYMVPVKNEDDKNNWKGIADYMYHTKPVEDGKVLMKVDPGYRKDNIFFELTIIAINDDNKEKIEYNGPLSELQSRLDSVFYSLPTITLNQLPIEQEHEQEELVGQVADSDKLSKLECLGAEIVELVHELKKDFGAE